MSTDTPKIVKATLTEGGETFTAIATIGIIKQGVAGAAGIRTTTGVVYYNVGSQNAPAGPDANNDAVFTFGTGARVRRLGDARRHHYPHPRGRAAAAIALYAGRGWSSKCSNT